MPSSSILVKVHHGGSGDDGGGGGGSSQWKLPTALTADWLPSEDLIDSYAVQSTDTEYIY